MIALPLAAPAVKAILSVCEAVVIAVIVGAPGNCATKTLVKVGAVNVLTATLVAGSAMDPPFKSIVVATAIPSVSISLISVGTV